MNFKFTDYFEVFLVGTFQIFITEYFNVYSFDLSYCNFLRYPHVKMLLYLCSRSYIDTRDMPSKARGAIHVP